MNLHHSFSIAKYGPNLIILFQTSISTLASAKFMEFIVTALFCGHFFQEHLKLILCQINWTRENSASE